MRDAKVISGILCYCELLHQKLEIEHENCCALMLKNIEIAATIFPLFKTLKSDTVPWIIKYY